MIMMMMMMMTWKVILNQKWQPPQPPPPPSPKPPPLYPFPSSTPLHAVSPFHFITSSPFYFLQPFTFLFVLRREGSVSVMPAFLFQFCDNKITVGGQQRQHGFSPYLPFIVFFFVYLLFAFLKALFVIFSSLLKYTMQSLHSAPSNWCKFLYFLLNPIIKSFNYLFVQCTKFCTLFTGRL